MNYDTAIILIPGAGMSDWIWEKSKALFNLPVISIPDRLDVNDYTHRKKASLQDCVRHIENVIRGTGYQRFVILGHSGAGPIAAKLAQVLKEKVIHIIYVAANIPKHNHTMIDSLPWLIRFINIMAIRKMIKQDSMPYKKIEKIIREKFCNDSSEDVIQTVLSKEMRSEPLSAITEKMDWSQFPDIPQTYLVLLKDQTLSVVRQKQMASHLQIENIIEIESDHMVMLSHPQVFANRVNEIIAK